MNFIIDLTSNKWITIKTAIISPHHLYLLVKDIRKIMSDT
jgi:hypothetical protein